MEKWLCVVDIDLVAGLPWEAAIVVTKMLIDEGKMKIKIGSRKPEGHSTTLTIGIMHEVRITECYLGIAIDTDQGVFGIAQRDEGIEVMLNGKFAWTSMDLKRDNPPSRGDKK